MPGFSFQPYRLLSLKKSLLSIPAYFICYAELCLTEQAVLFILSKSCSKLIMLWKKGPCRKR